MENKNDNIDRETFLQHFPGYCLQSFDDKAARKDKSLVTCESPNEAYWQRLVDLNKRGAGVFFTPNAYPSGRRRKEDCEGVNAWYFEIDDLSIDEQWDVIKGAPVHPDIVVQTKKSLHCYFLAKDGSIEGFDRIVRGLVQYFNSDPACKDISRVLRVPGFYHNKGDAVEVKVVYYKPLLHTEAEMLEKFPYDEAQKVIQQEIKSESCEGDLFFWEGASRLDNKIVLERLSGSVMVNHEVFSFRSRTGGGEYIDVDGRPADAWIDEQGKIGSNKGGGPTFIQWLGFYGWDKATIAQWIKKDCADLLPNELAEEKDDQKAAGSQADKLLPLFEAQNPILFKDQMGEGYVCVDVDGKGTLMRCDSLKFEKYLTRLYWVETGKTMNRENVAKVMKLISAKSEYGDLTYELQNRVAELDGKFWYDLGDSKMICSSKGGWSVIENGPILFKSYQHQECQMLPSKTGADVRLLLNHIRIKREDQQLLFLIWLIGAFIPGIAHPILVLHGEKGASKSTTMNFARSLIDPSKAGLLSLPHAGECVQQLDHHYGAFYDNVTRISESVSDILARAVTGAGSSKRRLFTDDDDVIYQFRRVIGLNGINNVVQKADLMDRSILIGLERIPKNERKTESDVVASFNKDKPVILAGIFQVLSNAMELFDQVELDEFPRMADFAKWGCAIAEALGYETTAFIDAYFANIGQQNDEIIENDPIAHCISLMMQDEDEWVGSPSELFERLTVVSVEAKVDPKAMPKSTSTMGRHVNVVLSNLEEAGIEVQREKDGVHGRGRMYVIRKIRVADDASVADEVKMQKECDVSDACDAKKGIQDFMDGKVQLGDLAADDQVEAMEKIFINN